MAFEMGMGVDKHCRWSLVVSRRQDPGKWLMVIDDGTAYAGTAPSLSCRAQLGISSQRPAANDDLLQPRPHRHVFQKSRQHRLAALQRRRHDHPIRLQPAQLSRSQIGDDHNLAPHQSFGRVSFRDPRQRPAAPRSRYRLPAAAACRRSVTFSATFTRPTRNSTLTKSSMVILPSGVAAGGFGVRLSGGHRRARLAGSGLLSAPPPPALLALPSAASFQWRSCRRAETPGCTSPSFVPSGSCPHCQIWSDRIS